MEMATRAGLAILLIYVLFYLIQPKANGGLHNPIPIWGSILEIPEFCSSSFEVFRRFSIFQVFLSPFFAPNILLLTLHLGGITILISIYRKEPIYFPGLCLFIGVTYALKLFIPFTLFYGAHRFDFDPVFISHLFHDCSSGASVWLIPAYVWTMDSSSTSTKKNTFRKLLTLAVIFLSSVEIRAYPPNALINLQAFLISILLLPIFAQREISRKELPSTISQTGVKVRRRMKFFSCNYKKRLLANFWIWFVTISVLTATYYAKSEDIGGRLPKDVSVAITISTALRPANPTYLLDTVESLVEEISSSWGAPYSKPIEIHVISYSSPENELVLNATKYLYSSFSNRNVSISFNHGAEALSVLNTTIDKGTGTKQMLNYNFAASLMTAYTRSEAEFIMLHEDDFPVCVGAWSFIRDALYLSSQHNDCGVFFATGGAGLAIKRKVVPQVVSLLLDRTVKVPADLKIQDCLRGRYPGHCSFCKDTSLLVVSNLVFNHIGFVSSMKHKYFKKKRRWSCGWRHAFNGDPDVTVLHTDQNLLKYSML